MGGPIQLIQGIGDIGKGIIGTATLGILAPIPGPLSKVIPGRGNKGNNSPRLGRSSITDGYVCGSIADTIDYFEVENPASESDLVAMEA